ncbi:MAG: MarR family transcriptional regulator [Desulfobacteraceae bacterium]|nr:MarR family transcriptional regulator [Desulfobacteraceae bacterium]
MELKGKKTIGRFIAMLYRMSTVYLGQELPALKIGSGQYIFLAELFNEEGQSQDELTKRVYVNKANTARALKKLEEAGYVRRVSDKNNKRIKRVFLKSSAFEIEEEFWHIIIQWSEILTKDISLERQDQLIKDLKKMADNAADYLKRY